MFADWLQNYGQLVILLQTTAREELRPALLSDLSPSPFGHVCSHTLIEHLDLLSRPVFRCLYETFFFLLGIDLPIKREKQEECEC